MIYSVNLQRKINDMDLEFLCFNTLNMRLGINGMVIHCRMLFIPSRSYEYTNINSYIRNITKSTYCLICVGLSFNRFAVWK